MTRTAAGVALLAAAALLLGRALDAVFRMAGIPDH